jgi:hypothetical protein
MTVGLQSAMARIQCSTHGLSGLAHVCSHLEADITASTPTRHFKTLLIGMEGVPDMPYFSAMHFCDECAALHKLSAQETVVPEEKWSETNNKTYRTQVVCLPCFTSLSQQGPPISGAL